jgi:hypothetical protein
VNTLRRMQLVGAVLGMTLAPMAMAQDVHGNQDTIGNGQPASTLPPPTSDNDPRPPAAAPVKPEGGVVEQAGVGGRTAYGRAGVLEFGGSAGFTRATGLTQVNFSPSIGWFFMDNVQASAIIGVNYSNVDGDSSAFYQALIEPSFHLPFSDAAFGFVGVGMGIAYAQDAGAGFALAPRIGANLMVGRSGVLTPSLNVNYTTVNVQPAGNGATLLGVQLAYGANVGYTVMF